MKYVNHQHPESDTNYKCGVCGRYGHDYCKPLEKEKLNDYFDEEETQNKHQKNGYLSEEKRKEITHENKPHAISWLYSIFIDGWKLGRELFTSSSKIWIDRLCRILRKAGSF